MEFENTRQQGAYGVALATAYFTSLGHSVSIPMSDCQRYDLIVDDGSVLSRVEVKTSANKSTEKSYCVQLATSGGNQSWSGVSKTISTEDCDLVFVATIDGRGFVFKASEVEGKTTITVGNSYRDKQVFGPDISPSSGFVRNLPKPEKNCGVCGIAVDRRYDRCRSCAGKSRRGENTKTKWPTTDTLLDRLSTESYTAIAADLDVSDNAIRNHLRRLGIKPPRKHKTK